MEKKLKSTITVVLPVHKLDESEKELFANAVKSVAEQKVIPDELLIVAANNPELLEYLNGFNYSALPDKVRIITNDGETDFASQINLGISKANTKWFSILEYDDEYQKNWFRSVVKYIDAYPDVQLFMPIVVDVNEGGGFLGFTNEAVWANSFSDELGYLDNNALLRYQNFNIDGMVMTKETYEEFGGFKPSIKLTFIYEFLLRMTFNDVKIMTIPKFGYKHVNQRPGGLFDSYRTSMAPPEQAFWISLAKKEYYHTHDRNIKYEM